MSRKSRPHDNGNGVAPGADARPAGNEPAVEPAPQPTSPEPAPSPPGPAFPVVGIGASAGGLAAFEAFFSAMPHDEPSGMAFVLVQHLSPDHSSILVELVRRYTRMRVFQVADGMPLEPNCTYIIPPNHDLEIAGGTLRLVRHDADRRPHLTVDHFFNSLATTQRERAICIVMSGTGSDGTLGLRAIKGEGGLAIAQSPDTTEYDGMPRSAIATGMVDFVLAPAEMPAQLIAYVRHAFDPARPRPAPTQREGLLNRICLQLRAQTGHDFAQYKETTLLRRIERRMALRQIAEPEDYLLYLRGHPPEVEALFRDLLIGVTSFFRDPEAFAVLERKVLPGLIERKRPHETLRVWVAGCSTGEEAYSIAILLDEQLTARNVPLKCQLFATDIDRLAIEQARAGVYPASIAANVTEERLARCFTHDALRGTYRIQKHIRDLLMFSEHDMIKDPPFSRLDLVSCRNVLIYMRADLQRKMIPLFHYALLPGGALFLGSSETVGESARRFQLVDRKWKLYTRSLSERETARPTLPERVSPLADEAEQSLRHFGAQAEDPGNLRQVTERALLAHFAQAGVLVSSRGQILHIVGRTGQFLEPADGDATMNVLAMAREGLQRELTVALHRAVAHRELVRYTNLRVQSNGDFIRANLVVRPVETPHTNDLYLVVLEEIPDPPAATEAAPNDPGHHARLADLELELRAKDEYLQTTLEEMETTHEELKSTNEELQSVNEELQSTNEELETSKEELQSVNEELSTVNTELQDKVLDLSRVNNDMNNLLAGTGVGTIFVDHRLRISRFTPSATQIVNLIAADVGRPLEHVASNLVGYDHLIDDIRQVLDTLAPREAEVQVKGGSWFLMRIRPYRTIENVIEGVVVTLVDITARKRAEDALRRSEARLNALINNAFAGVSVTDLEGRFLFANDWLCHELGLTREEILLRHLAEVTAPEDRARLQSMIETLLEGGPEIRINKRCLRKDGTEVQLHERISAIRDASGKATSLLLLSLDRPDDAPALDSNSV